MRFPPRVKALLIVVIFYVEMFMLLLAYCEAHLPTNQPSSSSSPSPSAAIGVGAKNLLTTRFGVFQCRARSQPKKESAKAKAPTYKDEEDIESQRDDDGSSEKLSRSKPQKQQQELQQHHHQGPKVIILPQIQATNSDEPTSSLESGDEDETPESEPEANESEQIDEDREDKAARMVSERRGGKSISVGSVFRLKLGHKLRRQRRQALTPTASTGSVGDDPLEDAARDLLGLRPATRRPSLITAEMMQQVISSVLLLLQQFLSVFVGRSVTDLPVRMANLGQLVANIITALTVNNPVLSNSLLLTRPLFQSPNNDTIQVPSPLPPLVSPLFLAENLSKAISVLDMATRLLRASDTRSLSQTSSAGSRIEESTAGREMSATREAASSFAAANVKMPDPPGNQSSNKTSMDAPSEHLNEVEFVRRLNELTSSSLKKNSTDPRRRSSRANSLPASRKHRSARRKRSIGSLLMFGPFSKFYMAMMLNRMLKYQSSVVSQAVTGELVRRFLMPTLASAFLPAPSPFIEGQPTGSGGSQSALTSLGGAINQMRQSLVQTMVGASSTNNNQHQILASASRQKPSVSGGRDARSQESGQESGQLLAADCQLIGGADDDGDKIPPPDGLKSIGLSVAPPPLQPSPPPVMSFDLAGIHFSPPNSALKYTILNPFNGLESAAQSGLDLQTMLKQMSDLMLRPTTTAANVSSQMLDQQQQHRFMTQRLHGVVQTMHRQPAFGAKKLHTRNRPIVGPISPYDWPEPTWNGSLPLYAARGLSDGNLLLPNGPQQEIDGGAGPLLNEFIRKAGSNELIGLLNQIATGSDSEQQQSQKILAANNHSQQLTAVGEKLASEMLLSQLNASRAGLNSMFANRTSSRLVDELATSSLPTSRPPPPLQVDELAESILNKTLLMHLERLNSSLAASSEHKEKLTESSSSSLSGDAEGRLVRETSRLLANSFAQMLRGFNFDATKSNSNSSSNSSPQAPRVALESNFSPSSSSSSIEGISSSSAAQMRSSAVNAAKFMDKMFLEPKNSTIHNETRIQQHSNADHNTLQLDHRHLLVSSNFSAPPTLLLSPTFPETGHPEKRPASPSLAPLNSNITGAEQALRTSPPTMRSPAHVALVAEDSQQAARANQSADKPAESAPLNNLAMALNVMNMVLLNQRLASAQALAQKQPQRLDAQTVVPLVQVLNATTTTASASTETGAPRRPFGRKAPRRLKSLTRGQQRIRGDLIVGGQAENRTASLLDATAAPPKDPIGSPVTAQQTGSRVRAPDGPANHRTTSSSALKSNATLTVIPPDTLPAPNYHYQPIRLEDSSTTLASGAGQQSPNREREAETTLLGSSETEHASRWNDILQHIKLAAK